MQGCRRNGGPETSATSSHDSVVCILLKATLTFEKNLRGLHGLGHRSIGHVLILRFINFEFHELSTVRSDNCCIRHLGDVLESGCR